MTDNHPCQYCGKPSTQSYAFFCDLCRICHILTHCSSCKVTDKNLCYNCKHPLSCSTCKRMISRSFGIVEHGNYERLTCYACMGFLQSIFTTSLCNYCNNCSTQQKTMICSECRQTAIAIDYCNTCAVHYAVQCIPQSSAKCVCCLFIV